MQKNIAKELISKQFFPSRSRQEGIEKDEQARACPRCSRKKKLIKRLTVNRSIDFDAVAVTQNFRQGLDGTEDTHPGFG